MNKIEQQSECKCTCNNTKTAEEYKAEDRARMIKLKIDGYSGDDGSNSWGGGMCPQP